MAQRFTMHEDPPPRGWYVRDNTTAVQVLIGESYTLASQVTAALNGQRGGCVGEALELADSYMRALESGKHSGFIAHGSLDPRGRP